MTLPLSRRRLRVWGFSMSATFEHVTVLRKETVAYAVGALEEGMVVDCTLGGGGHTEHLLETCLCPFGRNRWAMLLHGASTWQWSA